MRNGTKLTPTQQRIWDCLKDGKPHERGGMMALLDDELASRTALQFHISELRKLLPRNQDIVCVSRGRQKFYRYIQVIVSMDE